MEIDTTEVEEKPTLCEIGRKEREVTDLIRVIPSSFSEREKQVERLRLLKPRERC